MWNCHSLCDFSYILSHLLGAELIAYTTYAHVFSVFHLLALVCLSFLSVLSQLFFPISKVKQNVIILHSPHGDKHVRIRSWKRKYLCHTHTPHTLLSSEKNKNNICFNVKIEIPLNVTQFYVGCVGAFP